MIVSCPNCSTNFKVPEGALGTKGRTMKCARCSHVWRAMPGDAVEPVSAPLRPSKPPPRAIPTPKQMFDEIPLESPPAAHPRQSLPMDDVAERMFAEHDMAGDIALAEIEKLGMSGATLGDDEEDDPFAEMSDLMRKRRPDSMPDMYEPPKPAPRRRGGLILLVVVLFLLLAAIGSGLYYLQDRVVNYWPELGKTYEKYGLRHEDVGVGLSFRNYTSERLVQDNNEVLIVRGVIANGTDQRKDIPLLRLALYNGANLLQEKIISPPQANLEARATVGFKVTLDQPDANATRFEVTFTAPKPAQ